jgi:RNA polymerase sigma factor (TIGR02999 family)
MILPPHLGFRFWAEDFAFVPRLPSLLRFFRCPFSRQRLLSLFMSDVTQILNAIEQGDPRAAQQLLPLVYDELRKLAVQRLAQEQPGQTLQATALVHEVYIRLVGNDPGKPWNSRGHFFAAAAEAMRRILVDQARRRKAAKRGGEAGREELCESALVMRCSLISMQLKKCSPRFEARFGSHLAGLMRRTKLAWPEPPLRAISMRSTRSSAARALSSFSAAAILDI